MTGEVRTILPGSVRVSGPVGIGTTVLEGDGISAINVKAKGAKGDGTTDDTAAIQAALTAAAVAGGTVLIPPGTYLVDGACSDANRDADAGGLLVGSNTTVVIMPGATLKQAPSSSPNYKILRVGASAANVRITGGGVIAGDRNEHTYVEGSTHEWGYGIGIIGAVSDVRIDNLTVRDCTGDGLSIHDLGDAATRPTRVTLETVTSTTNRRHGLAVIGVAGLRATGCAFLAQSGGAANNGVAIEPGGSGHAVMDAVFVNCECSGNAGRGFVAQGTTGSDVAGAVLMGGVIRANGGEGVALVNVTGGALVQGAFIVGNGTKGLYADSGTADAAFVGNVVWGNSQTTDAASSGIQVLNTVRMFIVGNMVRHGGGAKQHGIGLSVVAGTDTFTFGNDLWASGRNGALDDYLPTRGRNLFNQGNAASVPYPVLATGAGKTVDNVITALQNLGLVKQS